jgi:hypothetical protein
MSRPLLFTFILSVAAAANGHASPAFSLGAADGLRSRDDCQIADPGCDIAGLTFNALDATVTRDSGLADGDLEVSRVEGVVPITPSEPMSYVLVGSGLLAVGSFARRRRRPMKKAVPLEEQIRQRAFEIYLQRGGQDGSDSDDWHQAEGELHCSA